MRESMQVFEDEIKTLQAQVAHSNFGGCSLIADNHTRFYIIDGDADLTFISELFNDVFRDVRELVSEYQVDKEALTETNKAIGSALGLILENLKSRDHARLYEALKNFRLIASKLQMEYWYSKTPPTSPFRIR